MKRVYLLILMLLPVYLFSQINSAVNNDEGIARVSGFSFINILVFPDTIAGPVCIPLDSAFRAYSGINITKTITNTYRIERENENSWIVRPIEKTEMSPSIKYPQFQLVKVFSQLVNCSVAVVGTNLVITPTVTSGAGSFVVTLTSPTLFWAREEISFIIK